MNIDYKQLDFIDIKLRDLIDWLEDETGLIFTITSLYRIGDSGVHGTLPVRGCDLRIRNEQIGESLCDLVNKNWVYNPEKPEKKVAIAHGKRSNYHIHLQVHANTVEQIPSGR
jgi:hypothetical protein